MLYYLCLVFRFPLEVGSQVTWVTDYPSVRVTFRMLCEQVNKKKNFLIIPSKAFYDKTVLERDWGYGV